MYVFPYIPDVAGGPGLIYFRAQAKPSRLNIGTIITGSSDRWDPNGKWQYAADASDKVLRSVISSRAAALPTTLSAATMLPVGAADGRAARLPWACPWWGPWPCSPGSARRLTG